MNDKSSASRREGTLGKIRALMAKTGENASKQPPPMWRSTKASRIAHPGRPGS